MGSFRDRRHGYSGGGIYNETGLLTITDSTLSSNYATNEGGSGGGIYNDATATVIDSTLSGNSASSVGGILNGGSGTLTIAHSTLSGNSGGGIFNSGGTVSVAATIVANSTSGGDCSGSVTDDGYNIDDDGSCGFSGTSTSHSTTLDSTLGALANNGGPTQTIALLPHSPAIDQVPSADCPATDQRGAPRTAPCDIGAYDTDGNPTIKSFTPAKGRVGKKVTIKGTNLSGATAVTFSGTTAVITTDTATKVTTRVPAGATTGPIKVTTSVGGTVTSSKTFKVK